MQHTPTKRSPGHGEVGLQSSATLSTRATPVSRGTVALSVAADPVLAAPPAASATGQASAQVTPAMNATATATGAAADDDYSADIPLPAANQLGKHLPAVPVVVACRQCSRSRRCNDHQLRLVRSVRAWLNNVNRFNRSSVEHRRTRPGRALPRSLGAKIEVAVALMNKLMVQQSAVASVHKPLPTYVRYGWAVEPMVTSGYHLLVCVLLISGSVTEALAVVALHVQCATVQVSSCCVWRTG